jgi:hypothetical protein
MDKWAGGRGDMKLATNKRRVPVHFIARSGLSAAIQEVLYCTHSRRVVWTRANDNITRRRSKTTPRYPMAIHCPGRPGSVQGRVLYHDWVQHERIACQCRSLFRVSELSHCEAILAGPGREGSRS